MAKYKLMNTTDKAVDGTETTSQTHIKLTEGDINYMFPKSNDNRHYRDYLEWVAAGNTPEAAD